MSSGTNARVTSIHPTALARTSARKCSALISNGPLLGDRAENAGIGFGGVDQEVNITTGSYL